jgi:hypothetical protein
VIAARLTRIHVVRPLKSGPAAGLAATERDRAAGGPSGPDGIELLATSLGACPVHSAAAAHAAVPSASAKLVSVVDPDDSSDDSHPGRPAARSPGAVLCPSAPSAGRRAGELGTRAAELIQ